MASISFNDIPAALRLPGVFIEFDNSLAGNAVFQAKILLTGQRLTTGTKTAGNLDRVTSATQAEDYYGRGSMLAEMIKALKDANRFMETWAIPLDDADAAAAATGSIAIGSAATGAGTLAIYIAGKRVRVGVAAGDATSAIATAIADAVNADTTLPVTAAATTGTVTLTARQAGDSGNDIDLRLNYYGEETPAGVTVTITALSGGSANPDIATAIASFGDEWWNWIVMPYTDSANLTALDDELDDRWGPMRQIGARAFTAFRGTHSETGTFGNGRNSPHVTTMGTNSAPTPPWIWAAVNAVIAGASLAIDPARPVQRLELPGILGPSATDRWTDTERNQLLYDGIATYTVAADGTVRIERQITNYQTNAAGIADDSYLDINTPETLERIRYRQRSRFLQKYPRHKLAENDARVGAGQAVMQPKIARAELLALYREMEADAWVQDYEGYSQSLVVAIDDSNPSRLNVQDSPKLVGAYRIHAAQTQFRR